MNQDKKQQNQQDNQDKKQQNQQDNQDKKQQNQQDNQDKQQQGQQYNQNKQQQVQQDNQDKKQQVQQDNQDKQEQVQQDNQDKQQQVQQDNLHQELIEEKNRFIRLFAEFENYKKRIQKERLDLLKTANKDVLISLLPVLDDFERGVLEINKSEGMMLIREKFINILKEKGLKKATIEKGDTFNTDLHEAITQIDTSKSHLKGKIVNVIESGYILGDKVIRHAKVIIGK